VLRLGRSGKPTWQHPSPSHSVEIDESSSVLRFVRSGDPTWQHPSPSHSVELMRLGLIAVARFDTEQSIPNAAIHKMFDRGENVLLPN
jgi:hypothetical protein